MKKQILTIALTAILMMVSGGFCLAAQESDDSPFFFTCPPYLQSTGDGEITVSWGTNVPAVSWVEVAPIDGTHFYNSARPKYFDTNFGKKKVGTVHKVKVDGLTPGKPYYYRIYSQQVTKLSPYDTRLGRVIANDVFRNSPYTMRVPDLKKDTIRFGMMNDIHGDSELMKNDFRLLDADKLDFMVLNGDMVSSMDSITQMFDGMLKTASETFANTIPFYMTRGNHETRGNASEEFTRIFATSTNQPYYSFSAGPVSFLVLDAGEDKPDTDIEYGGLADFDRYRTQEAQWLKQQVESPEWKNATYRVVLIHVPIRPDGWHGEVDLYSKFMPILNKAGVDVMLCAHYHSNHFFAAGSEGRNFPLIVNSNKGVLDVEATPTAMTINSISPEGTSKTLLTIPAK